MAQHESAQKQNTLGFFSLENKKNYFFSLNFFFLPPLVKNIPKLPSQISLTVCRSEVLISPCSCSPWLSLPTLSLMCPVSLVKSSNLSLKIYFSTHACAAPCTKGTGFGSDLKVSLLHNEYWYPPPPVLSQQDGCTAVTMNMQKIAIGITKYSFST